jgi:hypothetical protein
MVLFLVTQGCHQRVVQKNLYPLNCLYTIQQASQKSYPHANTIAVMAYGMPGNTSSMALDI